VYVLTLCSASFDPLFPPAIANALASCLVVFEVGVDPWHTDVLYALLSLAHSSQIVRVVSKLDDTSDDGNE
jgi:hypothetical protein